MNIDLTGRIALVTGATGELGRVMVRTLASCGADVVVHYLKNADRAKGLVGEITGSGRRGLAVQADITDADSVNAMRDVIMAEMGSPGIVVNNAVIQYQWTDILNQAVEDYESQFRSCVLQNVLMAKAFIPAMIRKRTGRFIGINTECAMQNWPGQSAYVSGKRGMDGVLRVLAKEVGEHQITVNQIAPGWTISDDDRIADRDKEGAHSARIPMRRRGTDQEVANMVAFLASDLAGYVTGAFIPVCGGNVMPCI